MSDRNFLLHKIPLQGQFLTIFVTGAEPSHSPAVSVGCLLTPLSHLNRSGFIRKMIPSHHIKFYSGFAFQDCHLQLHFPSQGVDWGVRSEDLPQCRLLSAKLLSIFTKSDKNCLPHTMCTRVQSWLGRAVSEQI